MAELLLALHLRSRELWCRHCRIERVHGEGKVDLEGGSAVDVF